MANIFKSKELYMKHQNELYTTRGVYVAGMHKEPYYIDDGIVVSRLNSNKANIVDFTVVNVDTHTDPVVNIIDVGVSELEIVNYSTTSFSLSSDPVINIIGIEVGDIELVEYYTTHVDLIPDPTVNIIEVSASDLETVLFDHKRYDNVEFMICVTSLSSTKASITN